MINNLQTVIYYKKFVKDGKIHNLKDTVHKKLMNMYSSDVSNLYLFLMNFSFTSH